MIEFDNVSKSFWTGTQRKVILNRASFRVEIGKSLGILAPNGTGKTTIINMMAGLEKPDEGTITRTCRVSFPLGFMGGVNGKQSAHGKRALHRQALRPGPGLCRKLLPLAVQSGRILPHARRAPIPRG